MIRLNRMTDYAAVVLSVMASAHHHGEKGSLSTTDISARSGLGQPTVAKIMKQLSQAGLVNATRGKDGGYSLTRAPEAIAVATIIEAMEGPIALTACVETASDPCASRNSCFISGHWERVNTSIADALEAVTLADLTNPEYSFCPHPAVPDHLDTSRSVKAHVGNR